MAAYARPVVLAQCSGFERNKDTEFLALLLNFWNELLIAP
jgi:hypothetical protein